MSTTILQGDALARLREMADESIHCVVTSPPYWGLRDYGVAGQIGLEASLGAHIQILVDVFHEVRRVLRKDGTLWLNYGDAYASAPNGRSVADIKKLGTDDRTFRDKPINTCGAVYVPDAEPRSRVGARANKGNLGGDHRGRVFAGGIMKPKDRMLLPARVAIALWEDGWYLRDEIIWHKPNPMPSSVKDRTTPAHEMIYMFSRRPRYFYDHEAIKEDAAYFGLKNQDASGFKNPSSYKGKNKEGYNSSLKISVPGAWDTTKGTGGHGTVHRGGRTGAEYLEIKSGKNEESGDHQKIGFNARWDDAEQQGLPAKRAKRSVWTVAPKPFTEAHFATFPPNLIRPCILAGCPAGGVVLDPFFGAGTVAIVCNEEDRDCIGIELNPAYINIAEMRSGMYPHIEALL